MQKLLPGMQEMITAGNTQRELAEHFGLENKYAAKQLLAWEQSSALQILG